MPKRSNTPQAVGIMTKINQLTKQLALTPATASQLVLTLYIQEAFLVRLVASPFAQDLVLGGSQRLFRRDVLRGLLGARPSRDIDFRCQITNDPVQLHALLEAILSIPVEDGVAFDSAIQLTPILAQIGQKGMQARVDGYVGVARATLWCDFSFGSPLVPGQETLLLPKLLRPNETLLVNCYPLETVLAGKIAALLEHGNQDSRSKDAYDIWFLAQRLDFLGNALRAALEAICAYQGLPLDPEAEAFVSPTFLTDAHQLALWDQFARKIGTRGELPPFATAMEMVHRLYGPVLRGEVGGKLWDHRVLRWGEPLAQP